MCGIFGAWYKRGGVDRDVLERGITAIRHRGPDGRGYWLSEDKTAGLGHARLALVDLQTGRQPISNETDDIHIVVNGEFYDHERVRDELESRGHRFRTRSDSEIALHLYEEYGVHCVEQLRGEFALIICDMRKRQLFAARDRFGIKPLHYAETAQGLLFASEAKALFAAGVPARWDPVAFYNNLCGMVPLPAQDTLFDGIHQVGAGQFLLANAEGIRTQRYWDLDFPVFPPGEPRTELTVEERAQLADVLEESIRLRLQADVPVGVYLSGGIDSSALLGFAVRYASTPIRAFTVGFDSAALDEQADAAKTAAHVGASYHPLHLTSDLLADSFADAVFHSEYAHTNPNGVAKFLLSRHTQAHDTKAVLAGEGADELFMGYPWLVLDLLKNDLKTADPTGFFAKLGPAAATMAYAARAISMYAAGHPTMVRIKQTLGFVPSLMALNAAYYLRPEVRAMMKPIWYDRIGDGDYIGRLLGALDIEGQMHGRERSRQAAYVQWRSTLPSYNLNVLGDRMEMAHSIEGRVPYLDHHFVEAVNKIPATTFFRESMDKYPLREIARSVVPNEVYERPKHMFMAPDLDLDSRFGQLVNDTLHGSTLKNHPFYERDAVLDALDKLGSMPLIQSRVMCTVVSACVLQDRFSLSAP